MTVTMIRNWQSPLANGQALLYRLKKFFVYAGGALEPSPVHAVHNAVDGAVHCFHRLAIDAIWSR